MCHPPSPFTRPLSLSLFPFGTSNWTPSALSSASSFKNLNALVSFSKLNGGRHVQFIIYSTKNIEASCVSMCICYTHNAYFWVAGMRVLHSTPAKLPANVFFWICLAESQWARTFQNPAIYCHISDGVRSALSLEVPWITLQNPSAQIQIRTPCWEPFHLTKAP